MKAALFALRLFRRDWRSGELRLLTLALVLAVAAVTAVGFFTNRVERAMELQAAEMLAADLVVSSNNPIPETFSDHAAKTGMQSARTLSFRSVILRDDQTQLVEVKAVSPEYPLRGELRTRLSVNAPEQAALETPQPGSLWVGARLLAALGMETGQALSLGETSFQVSRVISRDSGDGGNLFNLGPRVLMPMADIPGTGLVTPASRVRHRLLVAGERSAVEEYRAWVKNRLPAGARLEHMENARPELRNALDRGRRFLALAALAAVLVAGAAVALSTHRFVESQSDSSAIMRCLGATQAFIRKVLLMRLLLLGCMTGLVGSLGGYLAQFSLAALVGDWFSAELPAPDLYPLFLGLGTGLITLAGFTLAPLSRLSSVPPLRVLRRDLGATPPAFWIVGLSAFLAMGLLMLWAADNAKLALMVMGGAIGTLVLLILTARLLVLLLSPLRHRGSAIWRYGLAGLARNPAMTAIQLTGFGLGILALLLLAIVRVDLISTWERTIPPETPNQFLINIQPEDVPALKTFFNDNQVRHKGIYPMLRARLVKINQDSVSADSYKDDRAQRLVTREFNLSWAKDLQSDNAVVSGRWWTEGQLDEALFSVEEGIAQTLGIQMNDLLTFNLAGIPIEAKVSNLRSVQWDNFQPNFFVTGTPGLLKHHPSTSITSFYLPPGGEKTLSSLIRQFPSVTAIDVSAIMGHVREIMERGSLAVEYVFFFTLAAGLLVLYAGVQASRESRRQESAILRTIGLKQGQLLQAVGIEFFVLGLLAGLLGSLCASLTGWFVSTEILGLGYQFNPWVWLVGIVGGSLGIGSAGVIATFPMVIRPPLHTLRQT
ncbi:MAG: FtsX-like permease family protein [Candidatus Sedimenticola sp. PURPLELP]